MPSTGPLFTFALFQTWADEYYWFGCCHHIVVDGTGIALVARRIATVYSAIVSGAPIPPAFFGSLRELVSCESQYEASTDYLEDQAYWTANLPPENEPRYRLPQAASDGIHIGRLRRFGWTPAVRRQFKSYPTAWSVRRTSVLTAACALLVRGWGAQAQRWCSTSRSAGECIRH